MNILIYTQNHEPGGGNRYLIDFINALPEGSTVDILTNKGALFKQDFDKINRAYKITELDIYCDFEIISRLSGKFMLLPFLYLYKVTNRISLTGILLSIIYKRHNCKIFKGYLKNEKYDLAIAFNGGYPAGLSCFDFLICVKDHCLKTALSVVSMPAKYTYKDRFYKNSDNSIDKYIVNCNAIKNDLSRTRNIHESKFQVIHNCVDLPDQFKIKNTSDGLIRFAFIGRTEKAKGIFVLIEAFISALKQCNNITLTIYGKIFNNKKLKESIGREYLNNIVINGPFTRTLQEIYKDVDVLILPSLWEGFPYVILEAMSFGCPVIASDVGGISEIVCNNENGILVAPENPDQLSEAIKRLFDNPVLKAKMGESAYLTIKNKFTITRFNENVNIFISDLLEKK